jgi:hypothetical protein
MSAALNNEITQMATRVQFVRYYLIPATNRKTGIAVTIGRWPDRTLRHRGYTMERQLYLRVATPNEHEEIAESMRHLAYYYPTVESLLEDERKALSADAYTTLARHIISSMERMARRAA